LNRFICLRVFGFAVAAIFGACAFGAPTATVTYNRDVRPILSENCFACHGFDAKHRKADLRLDTQEGAFAAGQNGPAVKPGKPNESEVWKRISTDDADEHMPPAKSHKVLSAAEKEIIRTWIAQGSKYQKHWAFELPVKPEVPASAKNAIDFFVQQRLEKEGLKPSPPADRATILRRLSFDLTGLPPSPEELDAFEKDKSPDAYEKLVDRLLASPHFGERMAVPWLDLSRYGDTNGYLHDVKRTGWPWRDWVIQAFNSDKPFDQFVTEQIAGDMLPNAKPEQVLATAFCRNHPITVEGGTIAAEYLNEYAADRVQTFGTAFLGLTFNCCRCHDHKFDPLPQTDFYSLEAYFNSITEKHLENNRDPAYPPLIDIASPLAPSEGKMKVMVMQEAPQPTATFVLKRGVYDQPDKEKPVTRRPPIVLGAMAKDAPANRLGLAQWLVAKENPLLARVTVNRVWQQIFGAGIVKSVDDFGVQGDFPSHPELLDYLAVRFRDGDAAAKVDAWSVKALVRLIVTSETYRQASNPREDLTAKDPENRLLGRFPRQRLSAEEIRDQALSASGLLSPKLGGPAVFPYQPPGLWEERSNEGSNTKVYKQDTGELLFRRTLYTFYKRTCPPPLASVFDAPDRTLCTAKRTPTNTPLQALATLNDEQFLECARVLAARTLQETPVTRDRLAQMFRRMTGRTPRDSELKTLEGGLNALLARYRAAPDDAEALLKQGTVSVPKELDKPELAAWTLVASAVMNLDEALVRN
jgi:mono/diheme cytochrome c family protein